MSTNKVDDANTFAASLRNKNGSKGDPDELKVDPHFIEDEVAADLLEYSITRGKNAILVGPTGNGKSSLAINVLARLKRKAEQINCHGETSADGLLGKPWIVVDPKTNEGITQVALGPVLRAYKFGRVLLLEEVDVATAEVLMSLQRLLETQSEFYICDIGQQEIILKHKLYSVIATANTTGTGEDSFKYAGTKPLNQAFINRFCPQIIMDYLPKAQEIKVLINKTGIDRNMAAKMVDVANYVRIANDPAKIATSTDPTQTPLISTISTRDLIEWADMVTETRFDARTSAKYCFMNMMPEADQASVQKFIEDTIV